MSIRAMQSAATGMDAFMFNLDTIANNLANAGTTAFKKSRTDFEDLYYEHIRIPGGQDNNGKLTPTGIAVGLGSRVAATQVDHSVGGLLTTGKPLDVAITGEGFFQIQDGAEILYSRAGNFTKNADGEMVLASASKGRLIEPAITIPQDAQEIIISGEGIVSVLQTGSATATQVGQIQTVRFVNPEGMIQRGENLFAASDASGQPLIGAPGLEGRGMLQQGALELSNVEPVSELVDLIKTQRNFELNSQVVQAADQTLQLVANLRRF